MGEFFSVNGSGPAFLVSLFFVHAFNIFDFLHYDYNGWR